jgi:hypothetical protein
MEHALVIIASRSGTERRLGVAIAVRVHLQRTGDRVIIAIVSREDGWKRGLIQEPALLWQK